MTAPIPGRKARQKQPPADLVADAARAESTADDDAQRFIRWNVRLPAELVERVWGASDALGYDEDIETGVAFTVRAFAELLDKLEAEHNDGQPYHRDTSPYRAGRKLSYRR